MLQPSEIYGHNLLNILRSKTVVVLAVAYLL
jgi:hypothetical protein